MAELNTRTGRSRKRGKRRAKRLSTRVDLTPMVDLGFLLITFFFVTTTWAKPHAMPFNLPADGTGTVVGKNAALTVIACDADKVFYYHGDLHEALSTGALGVTNYGPHGIREIIMSKQTAMDRYYAGGRKELTLLLKAEPQASIGDVVDLLDEMPINRVKKYAWVDLMPEEKQLLAQKKL